MNNQNNTYLLERANKLETAFSVYSDIHEFLVQLFTFLFWLVDGINYSCIASETTQINRVSISIYFLSAFKYSQSL